MHRGRGLLPSLFGIFRDLIRKSIDDRVDGMAAEVAFFAVLSLFPGLLLIAGALGSLDTIVGQELAQRSDAVVTGFLDSVLTEKGSRVVAAVHDLFARDRADVVTWALLICLWTLSSAFLTAISTLDVIYGLAERRSWIRCRLTAIGLAVGSTLMLVFVLVMLVIGPLLGRGHPLAERLGLGEIFSFAWDWLRAPVSFVLLLIWATTLYRFAPNHGGSWIQGLPGALAASVLWVLLSFGFSFYLHLAAGFNEIYGVLGAGVILLFWFYLLSLALLMGGELNAVLLARVRAVRT